jgi:glutamate dehydrogenase
VARPRCLPLPTPTGVCWTPPRTQHGRVRVFNPTLAEDGFVSDHTVVQIVNDNMPFLVDSVTMAINRGNRTAHWIVHPLMSVARDAQGKVHSGQQRRCAAAEARHDPVESLIQVECDRIVGAAEQQALAERTGAGAERRAQRRAGLARHAGARAGHGSGCFQLYSLSATGRQEGVDFCAGWKTATSPSWVHAITTSSVMVTR